MTHANTEGETMREREAEDPTRSVDRFDAEIKGSFAIQDQELADIRRGNLKLAALVVFVLGVIIFALLQVR